VGLLGAIDRFDPTRGVNFVSFAIPTILGELKRYFRNTGWTAHVPRGAQELALRDDHGSREITATSGRAPGVHELAAYLELDVEDVLVGLDARTAHYAVSLDAPAPGSELDEPQSLVETLGENDDRFGLVEAKLSLSDAIARLPYQERQVLRLRIDHDLKQAEIGRHLGCSQMQVSRLMRRAAAKIHI
jgi:RNA polymerase sigma-B factor